MECKITQVVELISGCQIEETGDIRFAKEGGSLRLPAVAKTTKRYLLLTMENQARQSGVFHLGFYAAKETEPRLIIRFGILPQLKTQFCFDLAWTNGNTLYPPNTPGALKLVCHGSRIEKEEISEVRLESYPNFQAQTVTITEISLHDERPAIDIPTKKMIDPFGQSLAKSWNQKISNEEELIQRLNQGLLAEAIPMASRNEYGGAEEYKLQKGTGFFTKAKVDGSWHLVDPSGHAFFSVGPDCVGPFIDGRIDQIEGLLEWTPEPGSPLEAEFVKIVPDLQNNPWRPEFKSISFLGINLYRAWQEDWFVNWQTYMEHQFVKYGINSLGNWSDERLLGQSKLPYVTALPEFPDTEKHIFRDFPDVYSEEYRTQAERSAQALADRRNDPLMIGYFLRNEPSWAFVDDLMIADEVFYNPEDTVTKGVLVEQIKNKYQTIQACNQAYQLEFDSFADFYRPIKQLSKKSAAALADVREFSREMIRNYVQIPAEACRKVDPNHLILGMRWAWISNPDLICGWENFDVFSINCYAEDPTAALDNVANLGVDLPIMIGEFHHGALDAGLTATGLEGVKTQKDRGIAYQYYCERVAAHPMGVGCHYFQMNDQFALGRFDGENYNIGLFDICGQPYYEMMDYVKKCHERIYEIAFGKMQPTEERAEMIPMIAY